MNVSKNSISDDTVIQWHPAIMASVHLALRYRKEGLEFREEEPLGQKPSVMDMLIIKKNPDISLDDPIGSGFKGFNILEFKSWQASLSLVSISKVISYAFQYASSASSQDVLDFDDITITIMRASLPPTLLSALQEKGFTVSSNIPGITDVHGICAFKTRLVAYSELPDDERYIWLKSLTDKIDAELGTRILMANEKIEDEEDIEYINAVMYAALRKHHKLFTNIIKEHDIMQKYESYKILFEDEFKKCRTDAIEETSRELALNFLKMNYPQEDIAKGTGLPIEIVRDLATRI